MLRFNSGTLRHILLLIFSVYIGLVMAQTPKLIIDSKGHTGLVNDLIFIDGGRKLISVSNDKTIRMWDINTGSLERTFYMNQTEGYQGRIYCAAISRDEKTLALGGFFGKNAADSIATGTIYLLSLEKPDELKQLKSHTNVVTDLIITPENKLVSASADGKVKIWNLNETKPNVISTFNKHRSPITRITYSQKSKRIASADIRGNVLIWNLESGEIVTDKIGKFHEGAITSLTFSDDESMLFTGGEDGKLIKWTTTGKFLETMVESGSPINAMLSIKGQGQLLYVNLKASITNLSTGTDILDFTAHNNTVSAVAMAPFAKFAEQPGIYVATAGGDEKEILIWNTLSGKVVRKLSGQGHGIFATAQQNGKMTIAYGQSNPGELDNAPLEKIFSLNDYTLGEVSKDEKYLRVVRTESGVSITKESSNLLKYGDVPLQTNQLKDGDIRSFTFLGDHATIAIGSSFGIPLFSITGDLQTRLIGHNGEVWSVNPLGDDLLMSASSDQTIRIWNYKTKELLLTYFPANDREWVIWSPSGFYHASAGGEKYIGWLLNKRENQLGEFHQVSEFRDKFHRSDLIQAILKEKSLVNAAKTLNIVLPKEEEIVKLLPPKINWTSPAGYTETTRNPQFVIQASVESNNPLKNLKLMVNGRPFAKMEDFKIEKTNTGANIAFAFDFSKISFQSRGLEVVPASEVENQKKDVTIQLYAENEVSGILTDSRTVSYEQANENRDTPKGNTTTQTTTTNPTTPTVTTTTTTELPNLYMVSIGVSTFQNPAYNLNYADDDAKAIETVFKDQQGKLFNKVYNFSLINETATRAKILTAFDRLKQVVTPKDFVVIFIATHGINRENQFYILPHDGDASRANITCVNWRDFSDVVGNLPSQVLLLVDACHSGQLGKNMGQVSSDNTEAVREIASSEYGVVIMAASTGAEYSLEHADWAHGAFTLSLIEGLENHKADIRADGTIYLRELDFYVAERVKDLTENRQHPTTQKPSSISTMPVVKY
jgi:WD40 repeat protein